jgi:hypothetical protein
VVRVIVSEAYPERCERIACGSEGIPEPKRTRDSPLKLTLLCKIERGQGTAPAGAPKNSE